MHGDEWVIYQAGDVVGVSGVNDNCLQQIVNLEWHSDLVTICNESSLSICFVADESLKPPEPRSLARN